MFEYFVYFERVKKKLFFVREEKEKFVLKGDTTFEKEKTSRQMKLEREKINRNLSNVNVTIYLSPNNRSIHILNMVLKLSHTFNSIKSSTTTHYF